MEPEERWVEDEVGGQGQTMAGLLDHSEELSVILHAIGKPLLDLGRRWHKTTLEWYLKITVLSVWPLTS